MDIRQLTCGEDGLRPAWIEWQDGVEFLVKFAPAEEQERRLLKKDGSRRPTAQAHAYWLEHIVDWRGITEGGKPAPFDPAVVRQLWNERVDFRNWLVEAAQSVDSFRSEPGAADAAGALEDHAA